MYSRIRYWRLKFGGGTEQAIIGLANAVRRLVPRGDNVISPNPSHSVYGINFRLRGIRSSRVIIVFGTHDT